MIYAMLHELLNSNEKVPKLLKKMGSQTLSKGHCIFHYNYRIIVKRFERGCLDDPPRGSKQEVETIITKQGLGRGPFSELLGEMLCQRRTC